MYKMCAEVKDCMKKFWGPLQEHVMKIISFEKKKMIPFANEEYESYLNEINCRIFKNRFEHKYTNDKRCGNVKDHCRYACKYRGATYSI